MDEDNPAWIELGEADTDEVWKRVWLKLDFNPSGDARDFPGFDEPSPSVTFSFSDIWGEHFEALNTDLEAKAFEIFRQVTRGDEFIYALDWQHQCYKFYPHRVRAESHRVWEIPPLPNGDYYIFLEKSFEFGWLGHPWEETICVFGQPLLDGANLHRPRIFKEPVRRRPSR